MTFFIMFHAPFTMPRDWHGFTSVNNLIAGLICIERWSYGKYPMPRCGEWCV